MPRVSVIILSHRPAFLPLAIASVQAQTYRDVEIVVKHAADYWPNKMAEAMRAASGELLVPLCDDDELAPTFLARHVEMLDASGSNLVYSDSEVIGSYHGTGPGMLRAPLRINLPDFSLEILRQACVPYITAMFTRKLYDDVGGYDGEQPFIDWDLDIRFAQAGALAWHLRGEYLYRQRHHGANCSVEMERTGAMADALKRLRTKHAAFFASAPRVPLQPNLRVVA